MVYVLSVILLTALLAKVSPYDGITVGQLPSKIAEELKYIHKTSLPDLKPNCTIPNQPEVGFLLYTRSKPNYPTWLDPNNPSEIDPLKKTVLLIHGWLQSPTYSGISLLRDEYLNRYNCNFISVDWTKTAFQPYSTSFCDVPSMGENIADFLCVLNQKLNINLTSIHVIGHSMGGQIAGYTGQFLSTKCQQKIGRITGLDPSGPQFSYKPESVRLDASDAERVDVIHTDGFSFGYYLTCGDADFYPNCGIEQPGCPYITKIEEDTLVSDVLCFQDRSLELMAESINSENLIAVSCSLCPRYCHPNIVTETYAIMGENVWSGAKPAPSSLIPTNKASPYGRGWDPYSMDLTNTLIKHFLHSLTNSTV